MNLKKASLIAALHVAIARKSFTITAELLKPATINICKELFEPFDLKTDTTGENIFNKIDSFLNTSSLLWENCFSSRINVNMQANIITTYCFHNGERFVFKEVMLISV